jgi:hypothetical protein
MNFTHLGQLGSCGVLFAMVSLRTGPKISSNQNVSPPAEAGGVGVLLPSHFAVADLNFQDVLNSSAAKKYLEQNPRRNPEHVIRPHGNRGIELLGPHSGCA